jgi:hydroxymethylpyrimidine/phosphomethylpyrimidine kinase
MKEYNKILIIAGSDSGGGAGIQADIKTASALKCFSSTAITALTAQNTLGVQSVFPVPPSFVGSQIESVLCDIKADAVKIGMLFSMEIIKIVQEKLLLWNAKNIVLDPVMIATSGDRLNKENSVDAIKNLLMPTCEIITPNIKEAETLTGKKITTDDSIIEACFEINKMGAKSVLIKGGDREGETSKDYLLWDDKIECFSKPRIITRNTHGTGCTLSTAISCYLAKGENLRNSVFMAKEYVYKAILHGKNYKIGGGKGSTKHFF